MDSELLSNNDLIKRIAEDTERIINEQNVLLRRIKERIHREHLEGGKGWSADMVSALCSSALCDRPDKIGILASLLGEEYEG